MTTELQSLTQSTDASMTATERAVAALWSEVLQGRMPTCGADNFFEMGGDSLSMVSVLYRVKEEFDVELAPEAIFEAPTLTELSALIDSSRPRLPPD